MVCWVRCTSQRLQQRMRTNIDTFFLCRRTVVCVSFFRGCFSGALGLNDLYRREHDGLSGPTAAQLTVLAGLHDRVGFTSIRLKDIADPLTGKAASDRLFESFTSVSAGAVVLDHNACDLIRPGATVNVVPHLEGRVIVESPNGPVVQTNEGSRRFPQIAKNKRTSFLQLVRRQLECEKVRLRHDIGGGRTVFAVGKKHGRQREVWQGTKLSRASLPAAQAVLSGWTRNVLGYRTSTGFFLSLVKTRCHLPC